MKEIGIRKVLGASSQGLVYLLMKPVLVWLVVCQSACLESIPMWAFLLGSLTQALTIITIVLQTSKAVHRHSRANSGLQL